MGVANIAMKLGFNLAAPPLEITRYSLPSRIWPYRPLKIAIASDFHVGCLAVQPEDIERLVLRINALEPDLILLPGDFLNSPYDGHDGVYVRPEVVADSFSKLQAPCGVFATLGNHDIYEDPSGLWDALEGVGIRVINNFCIDIHRDSEHFLLAGVGDSTTKNADCGKAFAYATMSMPIIAMCHNPYSFHGMPSGLVAAVAGHTHGKQFKIPFVRQHLLGCPDQGLTYGRTERNNNPVIVTSGIGTSILPIRNVAPEVVLLTIEPV
jgi:predicted MPP superfamily phosphohydrolase